MSCPKLVGTETKIEEELPLGCKWVRGKALFSKDVLREHARPKSKLASYIAGSRLMVLLTAPLLYLCLAPLALSDLAVTAYQAVRFPIYGIPKDGDRGPNRTTLVSDQAREEDSGASLQVLALPRR